jgi:hypothetical protein
LTELLQGVRNDKTFGSLSRYLLDFHLLKPKGTETYLEAANICRLCRTKGRTIRKTVDCIIAAICIENGAILLHKDSDFDSIAACLSLKILQPTNAITAQPESTCLTKSRRRSKY